MDDTAPKSTTYEPGAPAKDGFVPLCIPEIRGNEWKYVKDCLDTNWVSSVGAYVDRFENMLAEYVGARCAVAAVNGTAALHTALLVAGVKPGDEVVMSDLTFIAPANAVRYVGAHPVFIDAEPEYFQMDVALLRRFITEECTRREGGLYNKATDRRIAALMPVHILGHPVDMAGVAEIAAEYELPVIEDATESLGARYRDKMVGTLGDMACFSFNGNKLITTGGGGMIVSDRPQWAKRAKYLTTQAKDDPLEYHHYEVGYNYRMVNLLAAVGCAQMEQIAEYITTKREIAARYRQYLEEIPGITAMATAPWAESVFWLYTIQIDPEKYGIDSRTLLQRLAQKKIQARPLWQPLHLSRAFPDCRSIGGEQAEYLNRVSLSLPCSVGISTQDQMRVIEVIRDNAGDK